MLYVDSNKYYFNTTETVAKLTNVSITDRQTESSHFIKEESIARASEDYGSPREQDNTSW